MRYLDPANRIQLINECLEKIFEQDNPNLPGAVTAPRTSLQRERRLSDARKAMIAPLVTHHGNETLFSPTREQLVHLANPDLTQSELHGAFGRLADAQSRLSDDPLTFTVNREHLRRMLPNDPHFVETEYPGRVTADERGISARSISRGLLGRFESPEYWKEKIPILFGERNFQHLDPDVRAMMHPAIRQSMMLAPPRPGDIQHDDPRFDYRVVEPRGGIFARKERTPEDPQLRRDLNQEGGFYGRHFSRSIFGPSAYEMFQRRGKIQHELAHEIGHSPTFVPANTNSAVADPQTMSRMNVVVASLPPTHYDPEQQLRMRDDFYRHLPSEWVADMYAKVRRFREAGVKGAFDSSQIAAIMNHPAAMKKTNPMQTFFVPIAHIDQTPGRYRNPSTPYGATTIPLDIPHEARHAIYRNMFPHLHESKK